MNIYIQKNGQNLGPYSIEQVNQYINEGQLSHNDLAFYDGLTNWVPLSSIEGTLFPPGGQLALPPSSPTLPAVSPSAMGEHPQQSPVVVMGPASPAAAPEQEGSMSKGFGSMFGGCMGIAIACVVVLLVLFVGCFACSSAAVVSANDVSANDPQGTLLPKQQSSFIKIVDEYKIEYQEASNDVKKELLYSERGEKIRSLLYLNHFKDWKAIVNSIETTATGHAYVSFKLINSDIRLQTWNNGLSDINSNTIITKSDLLYKVVADLNRGDEVLISGSFIPAGKGVQEQSITKDGSMRDPEFSVKFSEIKKLK